MLRARIEYIFDWSRYWSTYSIAVGAKGPISRQRKWVLVCVVWCKRLVVGSNGLQAIRTHSLARFRKPQTTAAIHGSRPVPEVRQKGLCE